jgi:hypothetical protein
VVPFTVILIFAIQHPSTEQKTAGSILKQFVAKASQAFGKATKIVRLFVSACRGLKTIPLISLVTQTFADSS